MDTIAAIFFTLTLTTGAYWFVQRLRAGRETSLSVEVATAKKRKIDWLLLMFGASFAAFGLVAAVKGEAEIDLGPVSGVNVRIGGALLFVVGLRLVVLALPKRNANSA